MDDNIDSIARYNRVAHTGSPARGMVDEVKLNTGILTGDGGVHQGDMGVGGVGAAV